MPRCVHWQTRFCNEIAHTASGVGQVTSRALRGIRFVPLALAVVLLVVRLTSVVKLRSSFHHTFRAYKLYMACSRLACRRLHALLHGRLQRVWDVGRCM